MQDFEYQQDKAAANAERLESFQSFAQGLCQVVLCVVEPYLEILRNHIPKLLMVYRLKGNSDPSFPQTDWTCTWRLEVQGQCDSVLTCTHNPIMTVLGDLELIIGIQRKIGRI